MLVIIFKLLISLILIPIAFFGFCYLYLYVTKAFRHFP